MFRGRDRLRPKAGVEMERVVQDRRVWVKAGQFGWCRLRRVIASELGVPGLSRADLGYPQRNLGRFPQY